MLTKVDNGAAVDPDVGNFVAEDPRHPFGDSGITTVDLWDDLETH